MCAQHHTLPQQACKLCVCNITRDAARACTLRPVLNSCLALLVLLLFAPMLNLELSVLGTLLAFARCRIFYCVALASLGLLVGVAQILAVC